MTLHLTFCRHADLVSSDSEIREIARLLERTDLTFAEGFDTAEGGLVFARADSADRLGDLCVQALRRLIP